MERSNTDTVIFSLMVTACITLSVSLFSALTFFAANVKLYPIFAFLHLRLGSGVTGYGA